VNLVPLFSNVQIRHHQTKEIIKLLSPAIVDRQGPLQLLIHTTVRKITGHQVLHIPNLLLVKGLHRQPASLCKDQVQVLPMLLREAILPEVLPPVQDQAQHMSVQAVRVATPLGTAVVHQHGHQVTAEVLHPIHLEVVRLVIVEALHRVHQGAALHDLQEIDKKNLIS
jgi:hypothetical protein